MPAGRPRGLERVQAVQWVTDLLRMELLHSPSTDPVPSEDSLIKKFGVSRGVVREVLQVLRQQGVIERVRGAGTFLLSPGPLLHEVDESRDLAQEVNSVTPRIAIHTSYVGVHRCTAFVADKLALDAGDQVVIMESRTALDGYPISMRTAFLPADPFRVMIDNELINLDRSPYELISDIINQPVGDTDLVISCSNADALCAAALRVPVGSALLDSSRVVRAVGGNPLEFSISHARADRLAFTHVMKSSAAQARLASEAGDVRLGDPNI
jgi:GntR family transcriptional regulator